MPWAGGRLILLAKRFETPHDSPLRKICANSNRPTPSLDHYSYKDERASPQNMPDMFFIEGIAGTERSEMDRSEATCPEGVRPEGSIK
jgi:hypothetical protein